VEKISSSFGGQAQAIDPEHLVVIPEVPVGPVGSSVSYKFNFKTIILPPDDLYYKPSQIPKIPEPIGQYYDYTSISELAKQLPDPNDKLLILTPTVHQWTEFDGTIHRRLEYRMPDGSRLFYINTGWGEWQHILPIEPPKPEPEPMELASIWEQFDDNEFEREI
jgi:hypothetical protein